MLLLIIPISISEKPVDTTVCFKDPRSSDINESLIVENYTWAIMRYDHPCPSDNFGMISMPTPTVGSILIPANMMNAKVINAAIQVKKDTKMQTLQALDRFDTDMMIHTMNAFFRKRDEWHTKTSFNYRKETAVEMNVLGEICFKADLVGDCASQASFNTAVLRLCGFSPEEVFTIGIQGETGGHAVNVVQIDDEWYVFDSTYAPYVRKGNCDSLIFETYFTPPVTDYITFLENDKYLVIFGALHGEYVPALAEPCSNMNATFLSTLIKDIRPLFNDSWLGADQWDINAFVDIAEPHQLKKGIEMPYTVDDALGTTLDEQTDSLLTLIRSFISDHTNEIQLDEYTKSRYAYGFLSVDFPQAYANAARLAAWTSTFAKMLDRPSSQLDIHVTSIWVRNIIRNRQIVEEGCIAYSDLLYLRHAGSSVDKASLAYGSLRNMKKDSNFWSVDELYIIITKQYKGYLAVLVQDEWQFLNFGRGLSKSKNPPENIQMVFNEEQFYEEWML